MKRNKNSSLISLLLLGFTAIPLCSCGLFEEKESVKTYNRGYTMNEVRVAESNTFKKLNQINYLAGNVPSKREITPDEIDSYSNFSNLTYHALVNNFDGINLSYCNIGLYSLMNEMYMASCREDLTQRFDDLLGMNFSYRELFFDKIMSANSYAIGDSTIQIRNGAFFNNEYQYNQDYIDYLSTFSCEAFQLNFQNEADKIVEWANSSVNQENFIDKKFLELTKDTQLYLFSTLYFKNAWLNKYLESDNISDNFYLNEGGSVKTDFMRHSYMSDSYYDYGTYISVKDYYYNQYASITYLVPKSVNDNIFELTKDTNIFVENKDNLVVNETEYGREYFTINMKTPKFKLTTELSFKETLIELGFADIFEETIDSFKNAFDDPALTPLDTIYLDKIKQKNEVEFNEDGTVIKSISMASMSKGEAAPFHSDTLDVNLNQPFIYIIRDTNDNPIFVGHVDNPRA